MNLYLRYFDNEVLVYSYDEAIDFLESIDDINLTQDLKDDLMEYVNSNVYYPKRYKVKSRIYFIVIKTEAQTMEDFKLKKAVRTPDQNREKPENIALLALQTEKYGWYEGAILFKRVVINPSNGKCEYRDTNFVAQCKAVSGMDCYNRIVDSLKERVDSRSQFPSVKGKNFSFKFLGLCK